MCRDSAKFSVKKGVQNFSGENAILNHLSFHEISLEHPYLNPAAEDIYIPLEQPDPLLP
jgi:hypothetical protein